MNELKDLLILDIPEPKELEDGFLEIINKSHYENINSQVYAYFLDPSNNVALAELFLSSLMEVIKNQTEETDRQEGKARKEEEILTLEDYEVITELGVLQQDKDSKARIDICLHDETGKKAIIIENKIYHTLINPLRDYWNHFDYPDENKVGIVLTLHKETIPPEMKTKFVNFTHAQWIAQIKHNGLPSGLSPKLYIYLNDFFQTITNLTNEAIMDDSVKFYLEHSSKIQKAIATQESTIKFFSNQLEIAASYLNLETYGKNPHWRNIWDKEKNRNTFYTVLLSDLMNGRKKVTILIELQNKDMDMLEELRSKINPQTLEESSLRASNYIHFLTKTYELKDSDIEQFGEFISKKITSDFSVVMQSILEVIDEKK